MSFFINFLCIFSFFLSLSLQNTLQGEIITKFENKNQISLIFGSCYDSSFQYKDIFKYIFDDMPDIYIWHGDLAYVSRTKSKNYM